MMILAIDVYYKEDKAKTVGVTFNWDDAVADKVFIKNLTNVQEYVSGEFYKRELPCILALLKQIDLQLIKAIIVDGHVFVDNEKKYGLGAYLWAALDEKIPVIGVAKNSFHNTEKISFPILRGDSKKPLYISSIGIEADLAIEKIKNMKGQYRFPAILKQLDQITKALE